MIIAQAKAKGWTSLSIRGSEEYLKMAERVGAEEGFPIQRREEISEGLVMPKMDTVHDQSTEAPSGKPVSRTDEEPSLQP